MKEQSLNTSSKWKKLCCFALLFFYFSHIQIALGSPVANTISGILNILNLVLVMVMIPDIIREAKKFGDNKKSLLWIPLDAAMVIVLQGILWDRVLKGMITSAAGITLDNANTDKVFELVMKSPIFMGIMACVYGPVLEELLYRYTAFGVLYEKNKFSAYAVSTLLFGIQHVAEAGLWGGDTIQLMNMPGYIIAGLIFAFLYAKTKNICVPIGAHILANSFGLLMMCCK